MCDETKNLVDVYLAVASLLGAGLAFWIGLNQWRRGQAWQRAEQLDKFIEQFESQDRLKVAKAALDWSNRTIKVGETDFQFTNDEALLALRDHRKIEAEDGSKFPGAQDQLRDAYDAILDFMLRLEAALSGDLIEQPSTRAYFGYWLERFLTFDRHTDENNVLNGQAPAEAAWGYIEAYSDTKSVRRLAGQFGLSHLLPSQPEGPVVL